MNLDLGILDGILKWKSSFLKEQPYNYCDLETNKDDFTFVGKGSEYVTMIELNGIEAIIGDDTFNATSNTITKLLTQLFKDGDHVLEFGFLQDKDFVEREIDRSSAPLIETAKRLDLNLVDMINEDNDIQKKYYSHEKVYVMFWTLPSAISNMEAREEATSKMKKMRSAGFKFGESQDMLKGLKKLKEVHDVAVNIFVESLQSSGFHAEKIEVHKAVQEIRMQFLPRFTSFDYKPVLIGDDVMPSLGNIPLPKDDISELLYPNLGWQICPYNIENLGKGIVHIGNMYYSSINIEQFPSPRNSQSFPDLLNSIPPSLPFRTRFLLSGTSLSWKETINGTLASFTTFIPENKIIHETIKRMKEYIAQKNVLIRTRVTFTTWAESEAELRSNIERLTRAVSSWGDTIAIPDKGDPRDSFISSVVGFSRQSVATGTLLPVDKLAAMLPVYRPANPWNVGSLKFRTPDSKPFYYQPNSSLQNSSISIFVGMPGNGKDVLANSLNIAKLLAPGINELPFISIIEVEPSSLGFIRLIKSRLSNDDSKKVIYHRMNNQDGINPFSTNLGLRYPTATDMNFSVDFIDLLCSSDEKTVYPEMRGLLDELFDKVFTYYSEEKGAKKYTVGKEDEIDKVLTSLDFTEIFPHNPSWWCVVDFLFEKEQHGLAALAQTHAEITLPDIVVFASNDKALQERYKKVFYNDEPYIDLLTRKLSSAISKYPCFSKRTEINLSNAKIISLDLAGVANSKRETGVFAMFGTWITSKHFYLDKNDMPEIPVLYKAYYDKKITHIKRSQKDMIIAEYHRFAGVAGVKVMSERFAAEGRKKNVNLTISTQRYQTVPKGVRNLVNNQFLLISGISDEELLGNSETTGLKEVLGLSKAEIYAIKEVLYAPKQDGSGNSFLFRYLRKGASTWRSQVLLNTRAASLLWQLSTTTNDTELREYLFTKLGEEKAIEILLKRFPKGSANKYIEDLKVKSSSTGKKIDMIDKVGAELVELAYTIQ